MNGLSCCCRCRLSLGFRILMFHGMSHSTNIRAQSDVRRCSQLFFHTFFSSSMKYSWELHRPQTGYFHIKLVCSSSWMLTDCCINIHLSYFVLTFAPRKIPFGAVCVHAAHTHMVFMRCAWINMNVFLLYLFITILISSSTPNSSSPGAKAEMNNAASNRPDSALVTIQTKYYIYIIWMASILHCGTVLFSFSPIELESGEKEEQCLAFGVIHQLATHIHTHTHVSWMEWKCICPINRSTVLTP